MPGFTPNQYGSHASEYYIQQFWTQHASPKTNMYAPGNTSDSYLTLEGIQSVTSASDGFFRHPTLYAEVRNEKPEKGKVKSPRCGSAFKIKCKAFFSKRK